MPACLPFGGLLPLGSWDAQPACAAGIFPSECGIWISSETSSVDPAVLFKGGRELAPEDTSLALVDMAIGFLASECLSTAATGSPLKLLL